jgi:hypothetical protein
MDLCPRVSVLCCPVTVEALRRADTPAKESYQMSLYVDRESHNPIRVGQRSAKDSKCLLKKIIMTHHMSLFFASDWKQLQD